jgi:hypothetical protein
MKAEDCKSGKWRTPQGLEIEFSAHSPEEYRALCLRQLRKGFVPLEPYPAEFGVVWCAAGVPEPELSDEEFLASQVPDAEPPTADGIGTVPAED